MKEQLKKNIGLIVLAASILISSIIYAYATRYEIVKTNTSGIVKIDKWKGTGVNVIKATE